MGKFIWSDVDESYHNSDYIEKILTTKQGKYWYIVGVCSEDSEKDQITFFHSESWEQMQSRLHEILEEING